MPLANQKNKNMLSPKQPFGQYRPFARNADGYSDNASAVNIGDDESADYTKSFGAQPGLIRPAKLSYISDTSDLPTKKHLEQENIFKKQPTIAGIDRQPKDRFGKYTNSNTKNNKGNEQDLPNTPLRKNQQKQADQSIDYTQSFVFQGRLNPPSLSNQSISADISADTPKLYQDPAIKESVEVTKIADLTVTKQVTSTTQQDKKQLKQKQENDQEKEVQRASSKRLNYRDNLSLSDMSHLYQQQMVTQEDIEVEKSSYKHARESKQEDSKREDSNHIPPFQARDHQESHKSRTTTQDKIEDELHLDSQEKSTHVNNDLQSSQAKSRINQTGTEGHSFGGKDQSQISQQKSHQKQAHEESLDAFGMKSINQSRDIKKSSIHESVHESYKSSLKNIKSSHHDSDRASQISSAREGRRTDRLSQFGITQVINFGKGMDNQELQTKGEEPSAAAKQSFSNLNRSGQSNLRSEASARQEEQKAKNTEQSYTKQDFIEDLMKTESKPSDRESHLLEGLKNEDDQNPKQSVTARSYLDDAEMGKSADAHGVIDGFKKILRKRNESKTALMHDSDMSQIAGMITSLNQEVKGIYATTVEQKKKLKVYKDLSDNEVSKSNIDKSVYRESERLRTEQKLEESLHMWSNDGASSKADSLYNKRKEMKKSFVTPGDDQAQVAKYDTIPPPVQVIETPGGLRPTKSSHNSSLKDRTASQQQRKDTAGEKESEKMFTDLKSRDSKSVRGDRLSQLSKNSSTPGIPEFSQKHSERSGSSNLKGSEKKSHNSNRQTNASLGRDKMSNKSSQRREKSMDEIDVKVNLPSEANSYQQPAQQTDQSSERSSSRKRSTSGKKSKQAKKTAQPVNKGKLGRVVEDEEDDSEDSEGMELDFQIDQPDKHTKQKHHRVGSVAYKAQAEYSIEFDKEQAKKYRRQAARQVNTGTADPDQDFLVDSARRNMMGSQRGSLNKQGLKSNGLLESGPLEMSKRRGRKDSPSSEILRKSEQNYLNEIANREHTRSQRVNRQNTSMWDSLGRIFSFGCAVDEGKDSNR